MRWPKNKVLIMIVGMVAAIPAISTFSKHNQDSHPVRDQQRTQGDKIVELETRFPVADYNEPEPSDPGKLQRRREKGAKYDKPEVTVDAHSEMVVGSAHWANQLPAFPVKQSTAVVVGAVTAAHARMSNNKKGVYSEFTLKVEDVLKNDGSKSINPNSTLMIDREGGRVRLPSGKVGIYYISGQGMPLVGQRYLFFLSGSKSTGFTIVTGYELREGRVSPLDNLGSEHPFTKYAGADEQSFLGEVRAVIATPLETH